MEAVPGLPSENSSVHWMDWGAEMREEKTQLCAKGISSFVGDMRHSLKTQHRQHKMLNVLGDHPWCRRSEGRVFAKAGGVQEGSWGQQ